MLRSQFTEMVETHRFSSTIYVKANSHLFVSPFASFLYVFLYLMRKYESIFSQLKALNSDSVHNVISSS